MKANAPKRKIFDAVDMMTADEAKTESGNGLQYLPLDAVKPFHDHPFRMYEGERLEDMVQSIREHGVLNPVIVRKQEDGYEMLSGHNRQRAAMLAGIDKIPAIVKENLSDEDAIVYVIETNMIQRSFSELLPSEKAAVLAVRYEKISSQGKRNDILQEIAALNGQEGTCGHDVHKSRSRDELGNEYGMTGRNIARYMRVDKLIPEFKEELDNGALSLVAAVDLSYLSEKEQKAVAAAVSEDKVKLNPKNAAAIRAESGNITQKSIREIVDSADRQKKKEMVNIKLPTAVYQKYFADRKTAEAADIVEKALEAWFRKEAADIVQ
jgi:ParB family chromosome partitioning protein